MQPDYGPWTTTSCFVGLDFRVKSVPIFGTNRTRYFVQFKNRYQATIHFNAGVVLQGNDCSPDTRLNIGPDQVNYNFWDIDGGPAVVDICVGQCRFGQDDMSPYAKCDH